MKQDPFTFRSRLLAVGLLVLFLGCNDNFVTPNSSVANSGESGLQGPVDSTPMVQWTLQSPANGTHSSDTTPEVSGTGFAQLDGQTISLFKDSTCKIKLVESTIMHGEANFAIPAFRSDGTDDGAIDFFAQIGQEKCQALPIGYTLQTRVQPAGASLFRLMLQEDASTGATIGFNAISNKPSEHKIYYGTKDHGQDLDAYTMKVQPDTIRTYLGMNNAFVRLKNLIPNTAYYFVVEDSKGISARYWFKTVSKNPSERLSIIAGGDSRNNSTPRKAANLLVSKLRPHAVMFAGDMTGSSTDAEWKEWLQNWQLTIATDGRMFPIIPARGNHESSNAILENIFDTNPNVYYATTLGNDLLRIYTLNSESAISGTQTTWLESDLSTHSMIQWKFAQYHRPMRPHTAGKSDGTTQYQSWSGLFQKYQVNVVSEADAHTVKTTYPVIPSSGQGSSAGFIRNDQEGTVYIGEGCWGAPLRADDKIRAWTRSHGRFNHFNWIFVDKSKIEIRVIKVDNANSVGSVSDNSIFTPPAGLDIWSPAEGPVITIPSRQSSAQIAQSNLSTETSREATEGEPAE